MNKHVEMIKNIIKHGIKLQEIFNITDDSLYLCKKLRRLEILGNNVSVQYCNGDIDLEKWEKSKEKILNNTDKILHFREKNIPVFFNSDPRGYCLKIDDKYIRDNKINIHTDLGGYGIIAPDLSED